MAELSWQLNRGHDISAANWDVCAGNVSREVARQECDGVGNLLIVATPAQRDAA